MGEEVEKVVDVGVSIVDIATGGAISQNKNAKKAREEAERQAAAQREALAALEAEPIAEKAVMPLADDAATSKARRRSITAQLRRRGRASTILTNQDAGNDALGA